MNVTTNSTQRVYNPNQKNEKQKGIQSPDLMLKLIDIAVMRFYYLIINAMQTHALIIKDKYSHGNVEGLVQDCSNSIVNALELLQSCTKPSMSSLPVASCRRDPTDPYRVWIMSPGDQKLEQYIIYPKTSNKNRTCSWRSADSRCSNYIWVINTFIAY